LESRVLPTARRLHELGVVERPLPTLEPLEATPRPLTAYELVAGAESTDAARPSDVTDRDPSREPDFAALGQDARRLQLDLESRPRAGPDDPEAVRIA